MRSVAPIIFALPLALSLLACSDDGGSAETDATPGTTADASTSPPGTGTASTTNTGTTAQPTSTTTSPTSTTQGADTTAGETDEDPTTGSTATPGAPIVYVSGGNAVSAWALSVDDGGLTELQRLDQGTGIGPLAARDNSFIYAGRGQQQSVATLAIDPVSGMLSEVGVTNVGHNSVYLSVDHTGGWLLTADFGADLIQIYPLGADGMVGETPSDSRTVQARPHAILQDPAGAYVFVPHRDSNLIEQYVFDSTSGTLTPNDPPSATSPAGAGPRHMVFNEAATRAFVVNEFTDSVTAYDYDATTGLLTETTTASALPPEFQGDNTGADIHITPGGNTLYASMRGHDAIARFDLTAGLTYVDSTPTEARPREFGLGPFGRTLFSAGQDSGMLAGYTIAEDGSLTAGAVYDVGASPLWVLGVELPSVDE